MATEIKPYGPRVAVSEIPMEQVQRDSGLIVVGVDDRVSIGIIIRTTMEPAEADAADIANIINVMTGEKLQALKPGMVIYYHRGSHIKIRDVYIVMMQDIVAYEEA